VTELAIFGWLLIFYFAATGFRIKWKHWRRGGNWNDELTDEQRDELDR